MLLPINSASAHPYVLLNYQGKTRDVMTLAGLVMECIRSWLLTEPLMADTPLTLAETASVFGEMLTFEPCRKPDGSEKERRCWRPRSRTC